jgi:hypothetical protein
MELIKTDDETKKSARKHPETGDPSVIDIITILLNTKNARPTWNSIKKNHPEIEEHINKFQYKGNTIDCITSKGYSSLINFLRPNKKIARQNIDTIRKDALDVATRFWNNDPTLATDIIEKIDDPEQLEFIANRAQVKITNKELMATIKEAGGNIFAIVNDTNNIAVTGQKAHEIVLSRSNGSKSKKTRDLFCLDELIDMQFIEKQERYAIKRERSQEEAK